MKRAVAVVMVVALVGGLGVFAFLVFDSGGGSGSTSATSRSTTTSTVKFNGEGGAPFCVADQQFNASITQQAPTTTDPAALQGDYERRLAAVRGLDRVAPPEIKADVTAIVRAYEGLAPPLAAVGYDLSKLPKAEKAKIQTPAVNLAGARLDQYDRQVCKIAPGAAGK